MPKELYLRRVADVQTDTGRDPTPADSPRADTNAVVKVNAFSGFPDLLIL